MNKALLSSSGFDWCTPQGFFDMLDAEFDFALDVAATEENTKCANYYTPAIDGLAQPWNPRNGAVFCNPPYGREIGKWVKKAWSESILNPYVTIVMLLPARTDTSYFHNYIYGYEHVIVRFLRGRLRFTDSAGKAYWPAPFPSMVVIYNYSPSKAYMKITRNIIESCAAGMNRGEKIE